MNLPRDRFKVKQCGNLQKLCMRCNTKSAERRRQYVASTKPAFHCNQCEVACISSALLDRHVRVVHLKLRPHACLSCESTFSSVGNLNVHVNSVHNKIKRFTCEQCGQQFAHKQSFESHIADIHEGIKPFECQQCGCAYALISRLRKHISAVHDNYKPFACQQCEQTFAVKSSLIQHILAVHDKLKQFTCAMCNAAFAMKHNLYQHTRAVHDNYRPFACVQCGAGFARERDLTDHIRAVHDHLKPYACDRCSYAASMKGCLVKHVNAVHLKLRPYACGKCDRSFTTNSHRTAHAATCTGGLVRVSSGEIACMRVLDTMEIEYEFDLAHEGLTAYTNTRLRFDFIVTIYGRTLFIEFDGQHHYEPVRFGGMSEEKARSALEKVQYHDKMKNDFCVAGGYPLLRISYKDNDIVGDLIADFINSNSKPPLIEQHLPPSLQLSDDELAEVLAEL